MTRRADVGRADLIRLYAALDEACFKRVAEALGYQEKPEEPAAKPKPVIGDTVELIVPPVTIIAIDTVEVRHRHYRLVERRTWAPPPPPSLVELLPPDEEKPVAPLVPSPPLMPWRRLWPFLRAVLGEQTERHRIDLRRLAATVARYRPLRWLPHLKGLHWAPQGQLLLDLHPRLYPFWGDFNNLKTALSRLRGTTGLDIFCMTQGPTGWVQRWEGRGWGVPQPYVPPLPGTPVLIAGDLGCLGTEEQWRPWANLGHRLRARDILPVVLTPCPARWWNPALAGLFYPVVLDRAAPVPPRPVGPRPWPAQVANFSEEVRQDEGAKLLLTLLVACIGITPALLRHLRYALSVEKADVGSEAAAWLHPDFRPGDFALLPGNIQAVEPFRQAFSDLDPVMRRLAWDMIRAQQHEVSLAVQMEERALYAALENRTDPEVEAFLIRVAAALQQAREQSGSTAEQARFLCAWVNRRGQRMHTDVWQYSPRSEALWALANPKVIDEGGELPTGLNIHRALAVSGHSAQSQAWRLVQRGERFEVEAATREERAYTSGSPIIEFSTRRPMMQFNNRWSRTTELSLPLADGVDLPVNETGYRLVTDSDELVIEPFFRPAWAHTLGRDGDGLFVGFHDGRSERRAYWWNPGRGRWLYADGRELGTVELKEGFFVDEPMFRTWRAEGLRVPAWAVQAGVDADGVFAAFSIHGVTQRVRWIWPGRFLMGSPENEHGRYDDELQHEVVFTQGFWLAETACTQRLWQAVMRERKENPSRFQAMLQRMMGKKPSRTPNDQPSRFQGDRRPVEQVSWDDAQDFIQRLNSTVPGLSARLPTEAEWEYACRAGTTTPFSFGEDITTDQVNYNNNFPYRGSKEERYRRETVEVASLPANPWGLYEMHGNVFEWCQDGYSDYPKGSVVDPSGPETSEGRVLRGGSWIDGGRVARSAYRLRDVPGDRLDSFGFRPALGPELQQDKQARVSEGGDGRTTREATGGRGQRGRAGPAERK